MEMVYVVEREKIWSSPYFCDQGFFSDIRGKAVISAFRHGFFVQRTVAEKREDWKQIIPYVVLRQGDMVWVMKRKGGDEKRLEGMKYIGVGGHINPCDVCRNGMPVWHNAMRREFEEECEVTLGDRNLHAAVELESIASGFINDDSNEVGAVHIGLVYHVEIPAGSIVQTEDEGEWVDLAEAKLLDTGEFETWTGLILEGLSE